jgi:hypothetical protein
MIRLALITLLLLGCSRDEEAPEAPPPAELPVVEVERGLEACTDIADQVCECAETNPALADDCKLARGRITALQMTLDAARQEQAEPDDALRLLHTGRKTIASCMEQIAQFRCPAPATPEAP